MQDFEGSLLPVSYFSRATSGSDKNYPAIKLELLAMVKPVTAFKHYLYNRQFYILSDSQPLEHYRKISSPATITTRWLLELLEYTYIFKYIPGPKNFLPDLFSRSPDVVIQDLNSNPSLINNKEILRIVSMASSDDFSQGNINVNRSLNFLNQVNTYQSAMQHVFNLNSNKVIDNSVNKMPCCVKP